MTDLIQIESKDADRFWSCVQRGSGCWTWLRSKDRDGYGVFMLRRGTRKRTLLAHRVSRSGANYIARGVVRGSA